MKVSFFRKIPDRAFANIELDKNEFYLLIRWSRKMGHKPEDALVVAFLEGLTKMQEDLKGGEKRAGMVRV